MVVELQIKIKNLNWWESLNMIIKSCKYKPELDLANQTEYFVSQSFFNVKVYGSMPIS